MPCAHISLYGSVFLFLFLLAGSTSLCKACCSAVRPEYYPQLASEWSHPEVARPIFLNEECICRGGIYYKARYSDSP